MLLINFNYKRVNADESRTSTSHNGSQHCLWRRSVTRGSRHSLPLTSTSLSWVWISGRYWYRLGLHTTSSNSHAGLLLFRIEIVSRITELITMLVVSRQEGYRFRAYHRGLWVWCATIYSLCAASDEEVHFAAGISGTCKWLHYKSDRRKNLRWGEKLHM